MDRMGDSGGWNTPRLCSKKYIIRTSETDARAEARGEVMLPAAVVHPFSSEEVHNHSCESESVRYQQSHLFHNDVPSPYLLGTPTPSPSHGSTTQVNPSSTPGSGLIPRASRCYSREHVQNFMPSSHELELQTLRCQVEEIQNKLNGDIKTNSEYQQLLSEKQFLEQNLGATVHELQELKASYQLLQATSSQAESKYSLKFKEVKEKHDVVFAKYSKVSEELKSAMRYLQTVPTQAECDELRQEVLKKSMHIKDQNKKMEIVLEQMATQKEREKELQHEVDILGQEKEDLSVKLKLSEDILKDIENQRALAAEEGQDTKESLLLRLDKFERDLNSAKKLLHYRKTKIESLNQELIVQTRESSVKIQEELEIKERLQERICDLEKESEEFRTNEQKLKETIKNMEEKQKQLEKDLQVSVMQIKSHSEMCTTVKSLFFHLNKSINTLKDLVKISTQISQGITPDFPLLFGFDESAETHIDKTMDLEEIKKWLTEVKDIMQQLEGIRSTLQDKYAGDLAANVTCAQM